MIIEGEAEELLLMRIFMPHAYDKLQKVKERGTRFVHYCSASTAFKIIKNQEIWLRKTSCMNDFLEVEHGSRCLQSAYYGDAGTELKNVLNSLSNEIVPMFERQFSAWGHTFFDNTYIFCLSEHRDEEDDTGRLSMWRAYGGTSGVAFVLKNTPFTRIDDALNAFTSPVAYLNAEQFATEMKKLAKNLADNKPQLEKLSAPDIAYRIFNAFHFAVLSTKHRGFAEEIEWRVIHSPRMHPSDHLESRIEIVNQIPQVIYTLSLKNRPDQKIFGISMPEVLD